MHANRSPSITLFTLVIVIAMATLCAMPAMALKAFLKLESIDGDSKDATHPNEIVIQDFQWGMNQAVASSGAASSRMKSNVSFSELMVAKNLDSASPLLAQTCASGKHMPEAKLTIYLASKTGGLPKAEIILRDVMVVSYDVKLVDAKKPVEWIGLNFIEIEWIFTDGGEKGSKGTTQGSWILEKSAR